MSFEDDFLYPLYLLIIGGGLTGFLIPFALSRHELIQTRINRKREDHHKELEIKSEIVKNISSTYSHTITTLYDLANKIGTKRKNKTTLDGELFQTVSSTNSITTSLLKAYFRDSPLADEWENFSHNLIRLWGIYDLTVRRKPVNKEDLKNVQKYFEQYVKFDWDEFEKGNNMIDAYIEFNSVLLNIKSKIIEKILLAEINTGKKFD